MTGPNANGNRDLTPRIGRRTLLAGIATPIMGAALLSPAPLRAASPKRPQSGRIGFRVMRDKKHIGQHELTFVVTPDGMRITISVDIVVRFGPIPVFRYRLAGTETWQSGAMTGAEARTNNDGHDEHMQAVRDGTVLWVSGARNARSPIDRYPAPDDAQLATHWNIAELSGPWINPQNGELLRPRISSHEPEELLRASGRSVLARRYDATGDNSLVTYERDS